MDSANLAEFAVHLDGDSIRMQPKWSMQGSILRTMHDSGESFCDVTLFGVPPPGVLPSSLRPIRAHQIILAFSSKHLYDLLTSDDYVDSHQSEYHIKNVDHKTLQCIVDFIYTNQLTMNASDCVDVMCHVLIDAKYLIMPNLASACETFLAEGAQMKPENCVKLWCFARKYSCLTLMQAASTYIAEHLASMPKDAEFLRMPYDDCAKLLLSEAFVAADADQRCLAAVAWLNYDCVGRAVYVDDVVSMVPFTFDSMSNDTIREVNDSAMLWEHAPSTMRKLTTAAFDFLGPRQPVNDVSGGNSRTAIKSWYAIGGAGNGQLFLRYDISQRLWSRLPALPWERYLCGACGIGNRLVAMAGMKDGTISDDIDEYDVMSETWTTGSAKLSMCNVGLSACSDGDQNTYAVGGIAKTVEMYNWKSKKITKCEDTNGKRMGFTSAVVIAHNNIYVAGGHDGEIEKYDIASNKWASVGRLSPADRLGLAGAVSGDDFYLMGSRKFGKSSSKVEVFNIRTGQIRTAPNLLQGRACCCATTLSDGNVVCVLGGRLSSDAFTSTVETFDTREGKWSTGTIVPDMPESTDRFGVASV